MIAFTGKIVLDTNIILDLFVFNAPQFTPLMAALQNQTIEWIATTPMRIELARVLTYPQITKRLDLGKQSTAQVMSQMDAMVTWHAPAKKAPYTCKDLDDQIFIDLACEHQCLLLSKDNAVLAMRSRLARLGITASSSM